MARGYAAASVVALVIGVGCLGHSAWIYAKAFVAQRLIEAAWERTVAFLHAHLDAANIPR